VLLLRRGSSDNPTSGNLDQDVLYTSEVNANPNFKGFRIFRVVWGYAKIGDSPVPGRDFFHASGCFWRGSVDWSERNS